MKDKTKYNTNLASEFHVMSMLHRKGFSPNLTLGNKKSVDIVIEVKKQIITVDVKGLMGKTSWLLGENLVTAKRNHFVVLVTYLGKIDEDISPECYIIPSTSIKRIAEKTKKGYLISYGKIRVNNRYKNNWNVLITNS